MVRLAMGVAGQDREQFVRYHRGHDKKSEDKGRRRDGDAYGASLQRIVRHALIAIVYRGRDHWSGVGWRVRGTCLWNEGECTVGACYCQFVLVMGEARTSIEDEKEERRGNVDVST